VQIYKLPGKGYPVDNHEPEIIQVIEFLHKDK
jgi:hypothetical protein